jgi:hypothetical protein
MLGIIEVFLLENALIIKTKATLEEPPSLLPTNSLTNYKFARSFTPPLRSTSTLPF